MWPGADQTKSSAGCSTRTKFEQILISKMFMKMALEQEDLATIWGTSRQLISKICRKWCPRWGEKSRSHIKLQHLPMSFLEASQPEGFSERYHTLPSTEVDGKDLRCETIRKDNIGKRVTNSSKYKMSSLRWIAWSIPGTGLTTLVTDLFAARISECEIVRLHKKWLMIFPAKTSRLVDRGFAFCTIYYPNLNIAFVPAFMRGRSQMFPVEIINARRMSQDRYTCEAVFSRVTHHKLMQGILKYEHLRYATDAAHCGHFSSQLMKPMMKPKIWDEFVSTPCDDPKYPKPLDLKPHLKVGKVSGTVVVTSSPHVVHDEHGGSSSCTTSTEEDDD